MTQQLAATPNLLLHALHHTTPGVGHTTPHPTSSITPHHTTPHHDSPLRGLCGYATQHMHMHNIPCPLPTCPRLFALLSWLLRCFVVQQRSVSFTASHSPPLLTHTGFNSAMMGLMPGVAGAMGAMPGAMNPLGQMACLRPGGYPSLPAAWNTGLANPDFEP